MFFESNSVCHIHAMSDGNKITATPEPFDEAIGNNDEILREQPHDIKLENKIIVKKQSSHCINTVSNSVRKETLLNPKNINPSIDLGKYQHLKSVLIEEIKDTLYTVYLNLFSADIENESDKINDVNEEKSIQTDILTENIPNSANTGVLEIKGQSKETQNISMPITEQLKAILNEFGHNSNGTIKSELVDTNDILCVKLKNILTKIKSENDLIIAIIFMESIFEIIEDVNTINIPKLLFNTRLCNMCLTIIDYFDQKKVDCQFRDLICARVKVIKKYILEILVKLLVVIVSITTNQSYMYLEDNLCIYKTKLNNIYNDYLIQTLKSSIGISLWYDESTNFLLDIRESIIDLYIDINTIEKLYQLQYIMLIYNNITKYQDFAAFSPIFYTVKNDTPLCVIIMFLYGVTFKSVLFYEIIENTKKIFVTVSQPQNKMEILENPDFDSKFHILYEMIKINTYNYHFNVQEKIKECKKINYRINTHILFNNRDLMYEEVNICIGILKEDIHSIKYNKWNEFGNVEANYNMEYTILMPTNKCMYIESPSVGIYRNNFNRYEFIINLVWKNDVIYIDENPQSIVFPEDIEELLAEIKSKNGYYDPKHLLSTCQPGIRCAFIMLFNNYKKKTNKMYLYNYLQLCITFMGSKSLSHLEINLFLTVLELVCNYIMDFKNISRIIGVFHNIFEVQQLICWERLLIISDSYAKKINLKSKVLEECFCLNIIVLMNNILNKLTKGLISENIAHFKKHQIYVNTISPNTNDFRHLVTFCDIIDMKIDVFYGIDMRYNEARDIYNENFLNEIANLDNDEYSTLYMYEVQLNVILERTNLYNYDLISGKQKILKISNKEFNKRHNEMWNEFQKKTGEKKYTENIMSIHKKQNNAYIRLHRTIFKKSHVVLFFSKITKTNSEADKLQSIVENHNIILLMSIYNYYYITYANILNNRETKIKFVNMLIIILRYNVEEKINTRLNTLKCITNLLLIIFNDILPERIRVINILENKIIASIKKITRAYGLVSIKHLDPLSMFLKVNQYEVTLSKFRNLVETNNPEIINKTSLENYKNMLEATYELTKLFNIKVTSKDIHNIANDIIPHNMELPHVKQYNDPIEEE